MLFSSTSSFIRSSRWSPSLSSIKALTRSVPSLSLRIFSISMFFFWASKIPSTVSFVTLMSSDSSILASFTLVGDSAPILASCSPISSTGFSIVLSYWAMTSSSVFPLALIISGALSGFSIISSSSKAKSRTCLSAEESKSDAKMLSSTGGKSFGSILDLLSCSVSSNIYLSPFRISSEKLAFVWLLWSLFSRVSFLGAPWNPAFPFVFLLLLLFPFFLISLSVSSRAVISVSASSRLLYSLSTTNVFCSSSSPLALFTSWTPGGISCSVSLILIGVSLVLPICRRALERSFPSLSFSKLFSWDRLSSSFSYTPITFSRSSP